MSVSKPFVFALVCEQIGPASGAREARREQHRVCPSTRLPRIERSADGRTNPMVNAGAIATTSLVPGADRRGQVAFIHEGLSRFAGRDAAAERGGLRLGVGDQLPQPRHRQSAAEPRPHLLRSGRGDRLYTRQCSLNVSAKDLAVMGATLADGGVNPLTKERVVRPEVCHYALAVMATAGLYETSGDWLYDIGLPGKSGIGGGIVTVSPGQGRAGHIRAAARRRRQQRQGPARGEVPVPALGNGFVRLATGSLRPTSGCTWLRSRDGQPRSMP